MPSTVTVPNCVGVDIFFAQGSNRAENTINLIYPGSFDENGFGAWYDVIVNYLVTRWRVQASNTYHVANIKLRDRAQTNGALYEKLPSAGILAGNPNAPCPPNATVAIAMRTGFGGRSFRGRNYYVGLCANHLVGGNPGLINEEHRAYLQASYDEMQAAFQVCPYPVTMGVVSLHANGVPRPEGLITPVTSFTVDTSVDSQRRRLVGRGL